MSRWWIVAACFVALIGEAIGTYVFTPALKPIVEELGWTRTQFTMSGLFLSLVMMTAVPAAGMLTDRGRAKLVLEFGAICLGAAMYLFSRMQSLTQFYLITLVMGLGVGCVGGIPSTALVSRWFDDGRGFALGLIGLGHNVGGLILPPVVTSIITARGWRAAFEFLAYFLWLIVLPVIALIVRDAPRHRSAANPHAVSAEGSSSGGLGSQPTERIALREGIKSPTFWLLGVTMFFHIFYFSGVTVHFVALTTDLGLDAGTAATAFGALLGLGILGRLVFGWAADRFDRKLVMMTALVSTVMSSLILQRITAPGALPAFVALHGLSVVGVQTLFGLLVAECFGALNVGTFLGATMVFQVPGGVLGAILAAASFDRLGTYAPAFWAFTAGNLLATLAVARVRPLAPRD